MEYAIEPRLEPAQTRCTISRKEGANTLHGLALWRGDVSLPGWVNLDAVDPLLVGHLSLDDTTANANAD